MKSFGFVTKGGWLVVYLLVKSDWPNSKEEQVQDFIRSMEEKTQAVEEGIKILGVWGCPNRFSTRSYSMFEISEVDFETGFNNLKKRFTEMRDVIPEMKFKFEPLADMKPMEEKEEENHNITHFLSRQTFDFKNEIERINLNNWHAHDEIYT